MIFETNLAGFAALSAMRNVELVPDPRQRQTLYGTSTLIRMNAALCVPYVTLTSVFDVA